MSSETTKVYDFDQISLNFLGIPLDAMGGFDEEGIKVEWESEWFEDHVGADGTVVRTKKYDKRAKTTIQVLPTAAMNAVLSAALISDDSAPNGASVGPFLIADRQSNGTLFVDSASWLMGPPKEMTFKNGITGIQWVFRHSQLTVFIGGN